MGDPTISDEAVLRHRVHAQQLGRPVSTRRKLTSAAVLDLGVQETGADGAAWALALRGVPTTPATVTGTDRYRDELALAWTLRGAPHLYRRADLPDVLSATSPYSEADAGKRIFDAAKKLTDAGITSQDGLTEVATTMRRIVRTEMVKGELSGRLRDELPEPYLRWCAACQAIHAYEQTFRIASLRAGLELVPDTSPPVLRRIPGWPHRSVSTPDPDAAPSRLDVVRAALHLIGPATPAEIAGFLDAPQRDITQRRPDDAVDVRLDGKKGWMLAADLDGLDGLESSDDADPRVLLLGSFDLLLQSRDRSRLVADAATRKAVWPTIGRPGALLALGGGRAPRLVGHWRPATKKNALTVRTAFWTASDAKRLATPTQQAAEQLATHRGLGSAAVTELAS